MHIRRRANRKGQAYYQLVHSYRDTTGKIQKKTFGLGPAWLKQPTVEEVVEEQRSLLRGLKRRRFNFSKSDTVAGKKEVERLDREIAKVEARLAWMEPT